MKIIPLNMAIYFFSTHHHTQSNLISTIMYTNLKNIHENSNETDNIYNTHCLETIGLLKSFFVTFSNQNFLCLSYIYFVYPLCTVYSHKHNTQNNKSNL